jgi:mRNA interferase RelE/StbE
MADTWQVLLARQPEKILAKVPAELRRRLLDALHELRANPQPVGCTKLKGHENLYRVRVGDWRITYAKENATLIVLVVEIAPRGGAYRRL